MKVLLVQAHLGRREGAAPIFPPGPVLFGERSGPACRAPAGSESLGAGRGAGAIEEIFFYFKTVAPTARLIKEAVPQVTLVAGGPGFSMFAEPILERIPEFDLGVYLEGEESFPELLEHLDRPAQVRGVYLRRDGRVCNGAARASPRRTA